MADPVIARETSPELKFDDTGPDVTAAQELLNRTGALLDADGHFGHDTDRAVREFQLTSSPTATGIIDGATWQALRAFPQPSPDIPTRAVAFIGREEVGSRTLYETMGASPAWPGGASGVTIGIGYDLGYQTAFDSDWSDVLTPDQMSALRAWVGIKGEPASAGPSLLSSVHISWNAAWTIFIRRTLPTQVGFTRQTFLRSDAMPRLCFGVLVSLIYNRGTSMNDSTRNPGDRREMRDIRDAVATGRWEDVPAALRSMKRLWPQMNGLRERREREAKLFEEGLA